MANHSHQPIFRKRQSSGTVGNAIKQRIEELETALAQARAEIQAQTESQQQLEKALAGQQNLLHIVIDNLPDFIYYKDLESRFILDNLAHARFLGCYPKDLVGKSDLEL